MATDQHNMLDYYDYTLEQLMFPELPHEVEVSQGRRNNDKSSMYSHCKAEYADVDNLLIVDYDEFLYCPGGQGFEYQKQKISSTIHKTLNSTTPVEELILLRSHLTNATNDTDGCVASAIAESPQHVFDCYIRQSKLRTQGAPKVMSPTRTCPFFWVHGACRQGRNPCYCNRVIVKGCQLVHLNHQRFASNTVGEPNPLLQVVSTFQLVSPTINITSTATNITDNL